MKKSIFDISPQGYVQIKKTNGTKTFRVRHIAENFKMLGNSGQSFSNWIIARNNVLETLHLFGGDRVLVVSTHNDVNNIFWLNKDGSEEDADAVGIHIPKKVKGGKA